MANYREVFTKPHTLLVVIHANSEEQTLRNAKIAFDEGADGIFLVNHRISAHALMMQYSILRIKHIANWIGLNFLDCPRRKAIANTAKLVGTSGLWLDNAGYSEWSTDPTEKVRDLRFWQNESGINSTLIFGGVAFKYQEEVEDPARAAAATAPLIDVVTTSGKGTGHAADVNKIKLMKNAIGTQPLAIASGITPENVHEYMPHADCFLVSTGISMVNKNHLTTDDLDPVRVRKLVEVINS